VNDFNAYRVSKGLSVVAWDSRLGAVALAHSQDMVDNNYFSHTDLNGLSPGDRMRAAGVVLSYWGENIAGPPWQPGETPLQRWLSDTAHKTNIENPIWTHEGVGEVNGMWTQDLADEVTGASVIIPIAPAKTQPTN